MQELKLICEWGAVYIERCKCGSEASIWKPAAATRRGAGCLAYLDLSGTHRIYPEPVALAHTIKDRIRNELGFTVNVGIGENKLLAKMASDFEKPDKVHTLFFREIPQKMWPLPVGELFTVGSATADKLRHAKIMTIGDLAHVDLTRVQKIVGMKMGKHIHDYANGIDPSPILAEPEEAKGYSISTTLEDDVKKADQAYPVLLALADMPLRRVIERSYFRIF